MTGSNSAHDLDLLDRLIEEFNGRLRRGERPSVQEFCDRHPHLADDLRELLPAVAAVEQIKAEPAAELAAPAKMPEDFGDFHFLQEVGHGGMGVVYEAEQVSLGRRVALKVLTRRMLRDDKQKRRFEREARSAGRLHHTNIVPVFGVGEHEGIPYYVMQFIRGQGLDAVITEVAAFEEGGRISTPSPAADLAHSLVTDKFHLPQLGRGSDDPTLTAAGVAHSADATSPFDPSVSASVLTGAASAISGSTGSAPQSRSGSYWRGVARIGAQVAGALDYAHQQGVIHRDIKPSNLLLDAAGTAWVTDFGLAKADGAADDLTRTGDVLGTLRYMAPEAFEGKADARSDIYALGLTLYEMLALKPAFEERNRERLVKLVTTGEPVRLRKARPGVPRDLDTIIHKAIDRDPARRYATAGELGADLRRYLDDEPIRARRQTAAEAAWRWARRHPSVAALLLALFSVVLVGTAGVSWKWREAERNALAADANADAARKSAIAADESARCSREEAERADRAAADATEAVDQYLNTVTDDPRLQEPELTPLRKELLESARKFYTKFVAERKNDPAARHGLGKAYARLAILAFNIEKDQVRAFEYVQLARDTFEGLLAEAPDDPSRLADLASCLRNVAVSLNAMDQTEEADALVDRAIVLQQRVVEQTGSIEARTRLASILHYGGWSRKQREPATALELLTWECRLREELSKERPPTLEEKFLHGVGASWQAFTLAAYLKRAPESTERFQFAIGLLREVARAQPNNLAWRSALGNTLRNYAKYCVLPDTALQEALKLVDEAIGHQKYAFDLYRNTTYRERLWLDFKTMADIRIRCGEYDLAATAAVDAGQLYPTTPSAACDTVYLLHRCAALARAQEGLTATDQHTRSRDVLARAEPFRSVAAGFTPSTNPNKLTLARWLAEPPEAPRGHLTHARELARSVTVNAPKYRLAWAVAGVADYRLGNWYEAREMLERAVAIPAKNPGQAEYFLAMTLWQLGEADAARDRLAKAQATKGLGWDLIAVRAEAEITLGLVPAPPARTWSVLADADRSAFDRWVSQMTAAGFEPMFVNTVMAGGRVRYSATAASGAPAQLTWQLRTDKSVSGFQTRFDGQIAERYGLTSLAGHTLDDTAGYVSIWKRPAPVIVLCRHLATRPNFAKEVEQYRPRGYRPINISGFAYAGGHRFTTVYGPSNGHPWELTDGLTATELTGKFDTWRKSGYRLAVVYSYPDGVQTRFGAVFVQDTTFAGWEARVGLTGEEFREADDRMRKDGFRPDQVVGYDDGGTARYVGVWVRERSPLAVPFRPMTGTPVRELAAFDRAMQTYMRERDISAGTLAVMKDGKVILSRGYGYADKEGKTRTAPDELFRLASVSKPITAAGVRKLIQEGKLRPSNLVWDLLGLTPPPGKTADPRWKKVTVAHLLDHKGGWDRGVAGDPMFKPLLIAKALGKPGPATAEDVIAYMAGEPLQFEPGAKSVYSNFGYCVLGRVIEKVSGKKYIDYVRDDVLAPAGIKRIALGRTLPTDRDPAEPFYDDDGKGLNVMRPDQKEFVPAPDGSFHLEAMDAHGGLIGPADELVQFLKAYRVDGRPVGPKPVQDAFFGALPGTFTMLYQRGDGVAVVALFNRWHDAGGNDPFEIRRLIDQAADSIQSWPKGK